MSVLGAMALALPDRQVSCNSLARGGSFLNDELCNYVARDDVTVREKLIAACLK